MPRTREEIERRASALWAQASRRLAAALDALPVGVVMLGVGMIALTASNRLPAWLALPTRDLQMALAGAGLSAGIAATLGAGVSAGLTFLALLAAYGLLLAAGQSAPPGWLRRAARWRGSGGCCCAGGCRRRAGGGAAAAAGGVAQSGALLSGALHSGAGGAAADVARRLTPAHSQRKWRMVAGRG